MMNVIKNELKVVCGEGFDYCVVGVVVDEAIL